MGPILLIIGGLLGVVGFIIVPQVIWFSLLCLFLGLIVTTARLIKRSPVPGVLIDSDLYMRISADPILHRLITDENDLLVAEHFKRFWMMISRVDPQDLSSDRSAKIAELCQRFQDLTKKALDLRIFYRSMSSSNRRDLFLKRLEIIEDMKQITINLPLKLIEDEREEIEGLIKTDNYDLEEFLKGESNVPSDRQMDPCDRYDGSGDPQQIESGNQLKPPSSECPI